MLEYDSFREAPSDRKQFVRKEATDCDVGLEIGGDIDKTSVRAKKLAAQATYRQMLADEKTRTPIGSSYQAIKKNSPRWEDARESKQQFSIGSQHDKAVLDRNSREYHEQVVSDIHLREQRRLSDKNDQVYGGFIIGKEESKKNAKKTVKRLDTSGYCNVFPTTNDGYEEGAEEKRKLQQREQILAQATQNHSVAPRGRVTANEDTYVNYSGLTGFAIGSEGNKEEKNEVKMLKQQEYMKQLGEDFAVKSSVRADIASKQKAKFLGNPRKNNIM